MIKYTNEDIEQIFKKRVYCMPKIAELKPGIICEWSFEYPNGQVTADVVAAFPIYPENFDYDIGINVCQKKIKDKLKLDSNIKVKEKIYDTDTELIFTIKDSDKL